ncbi:MAG: fasciclin domain-containing protein, partial [Bacteroidales bacterium]|nr:fasciclin domain-containing protein [Bacteroidales bacterium]
EDIEELRQIVRYHICPDSISSSEFTDGGLPDTTLSGDYLITSFDTGGISDIIVNNEAKIIQRDINVVNGIIHIIDKVLDPVLDMIAEMIEKDGKYTIFAEALKQTGLYDSLNIKTNSFTIFAETDSVFALNGITSFQELKEAYSQTGEPYLNPIDSLYLWVAYHCIDHKVLFLDDFDNTTYENLTHSALLTVTKTTDFLVNESLANIEMSNNTAKNGVMHSLNNLLTFIPVPVAVYFDIVDKPEIRALAQFRTTSISQIPGTDLPNGVAGIRVAPGDTWKYGYQNNWYNYNDYFEYSFDAANNRLWFEFDTPPLVKGGTYNIWICGKCQDTRATADVYWDGEYVFRLDMSETFDGPDEDWETTGLKHYSTNMSPRNIGFNIGSFEITTEGPHKMKFVRVTDGPYTIEIIQFIPSDENQIDYRVTIP